jgi:hypothetical protein
MVSKGMATALGIISTVAVVGTGVVIYLHTHPPAEEEEVPEVPVPTEAIVAPDDSVDLVSASYHVSDLVGTDRYVYVSSTVKNISTQPLKFYVAAQFFEGVVATKYDWMYIGSLAPGSTQIWAPEFKFELAERGKTYILVVAAYKYSTFLDRVSDKMEASIYVA